MTGVQTCALPISQIIMKNSLIYELPKIVEEGKKEVEKILERLSS